MQGVEDLYDDNYWMDFYLRLRIKEFELNWSHTKTPPKYKNLLKRALHIKKNVDFSQALRYIDKELRILPAQLGTPNEQKLQIMQKQKTEADSEPSSDSGGISY